MSNQPSLTLFVTDNDEIFKRILKINLVKYPLFKYVLYFDTGAPLINYLKKHYNDRSNLPDVLFLDLEMPECSGWYVLETLKTLIDRLAKPLSVYVVSVSIIPVDIAKASSYSFVKGVLCKPLTRADLAAVSNRVEMEN